MNEHRPFRNVHFSEDEPEAVHLAGRPWVAEEVASWLEGFFKRCILPSTLLRASPRLATTFFRGRFKFSFARFLFLPLCRGAQLILQF